MTAPAPIVDILLPQTTSVFIADNTQKKVATTPPGGVGKICINESSKSIFAPNDSPMILGIGFWLPYCYGLADTLPALTLSWADPAGGNVQLINFFSMPYNAGEEVPLNGAGVNGFYVPYPSGAAYAAGAVLYANFAPYISQINGPTILNGDTLGCRPFMRVQHLLPLT